MTSDPVDHLLDALDEQMAIEPSPGLYARVRQTTQVTRRHAPRWVAVPIVLGCAAALVLIHRQSERHMPAIANLARASVFAPPVPGKGLLAADEPAATPERVRAPRHQRAVHVNEVVVSPDVSAGLGALQAAVTSGRLISDSLNAQPWEFEPPVIVPIVIEPAVVSITIGDAAGGGGATVPVSPPSRTGSVS